MVTCLRWNFLILYALPISMGFTSKSPRRSWIRRGEGNHFELAASIDRTTSRRWNGNYKSPATRLSQIPKAKKMQLELKANGVTKVLQKNRMESIQHVLTKAVLWKVFMDEYPHLQIELDVGDPDYLPDVVQLDDSEGMPIFWGEAGRVKPHKAIELLQRYPDTHIVHCRWGMEIEQFQTPVLEAIEEMQEEAGSNFTLPARSRPFQFCSIPFEVWKFVDEDTMSLDVTKDDLKWETLSI